MNAAGETLLEAARTNQALEILGAPTLVPVQDLERAAEDVLNAFRVATTPLNTQTAYAKALKYLCAWARARFGQSLPVPTPPAVAIQFIVDHFGLPRRDAQGRLSIEEAMPPLVDQALVDAGFKAKLGRLKVATIEQRLAVLSWAHKENKLVSPTEDPAVRRTMSDCRKLARELGEGPKTKAAATGDAMEAMLATCSDSLEGIRDRALLQFGFSSGGRRRSEIAEALVEDLEWVNPTMALFSMRRSKTSDQNDKPIVEEAAITLQTWLKRARITTGPIFRRIWNGARIGDDALTPHAIAEIIKRRADLAGLKGDFSGHSLRRGFVSEAEANDVPLSEGMAMTGHRSVKSYVRYSETGKLLAGKAARLLHTKKP